MTPEKLHGLLQGCPVGDAVNATTAALRSGGSLALFSSDKDMRIAVTGLPRPLPLGLVPLGHREEALIALDLSMLPVSRGLIPVVAASRDGFWRPIAASLDTLDHVGSPRECDGISLRAAASAEIPPEEDAKRSQITDALRRPIHTAENLGQLEAVQERALHLETSGALDPVTSRLAHAGTDPEAWRLVGAERAIAKRHLTACHCLHTAVFLGGSRSAITKILRAMLQRTGMTWARRILDHQDHVLEA